MSTVLGRVEDSTMLIFWCPGCEERHQIDSAQWEFNGDFEKPTFNPSYLTWLDPNPNASPKFRNGIYVTGFRCHSYIRDGTIEFLSDCTHKYAGKTIKMRHLK